MSSGSAPRSSRSRTSRASTRAVPSPCGAPRMARPWAVATIDVAASVLCDPREGEAPCRAGMRRGSPDEARPPLPDGRGLALPASGREARPPGSSHGARTVPSPRNSTCSSSRRPAGRQISGSDGRLDEAQLVQQAVADRRGGLVERRRRLAVLAGQGDADRRCAAQGVVEHPPVRLATGDSQSRNVTWANAESDAGGRCNSRFEAHAASPASSSAPSLRSRSR